MAQWQRLLAGSAPAQGSNPGWHIICLRGLPWGNLSKKKQTKNEKYKRNTEHSMSQVTKLLMKMLIFFTTWEILHDRFDGIER
jgi:hypothetical protein